MCGHACVAMLANTTPERVATVLSSDGPTSWRELYSTLFAFGVVCDAGLVPVFDPADIPPLAVVRLPGPGSFGHWVVVCRGTVYDPAGYTYHAGELTFPALNPVKYARVLR